MSVRALSRGLRILQRLGTTDGLSINEAARQLQLARGTAYRLLKTLESDGFVRHCESDNRYRLTPFASTLFQPMDWESWVDDLAMPLMHCFTEKHHHSIALGTLHGTQMITRASTDGMSPFALKHYQRGFITSIPGSSIGLAYLAFCEEQLRNLLIGELARSRLRAHARMAMAQIDQRLIDIRKKGYALSPIVFDGESAIAVPVFVHGALFATLGMRYIASAKSEAEVTREYLDPLNALAGEIGAALEAGESASDGQSVVL